MSSCENVTASFFSFAISRRTGYYHAEEELAKFGSRSDSKGEFCLDSCLVLLVSDGNSSL